MQTSTTTATDPVLTLTTTEPEQARLVLWCGEWDTPFGYWPDDDREAALAAAKEWVVRERDIFSANDEQDEQARIESWMSAISIVSAEPSIATLCAALDDLGYHGCAGQEHAGHGPDRMPTHGAPCMVYWVEPDGRLVVVLADGTKTDAGFDDGSTSGEAGWVAGDSPVSTIDEALHAMGVR